MKKHNLYFYVISFGLFLGISSCIKIVDIPLPESPQLLVVNSLFSPDSLWKVNISTTTNTTTDPTFFLPYVNNATVELWEDDMYLGKMENKGSGNYYLDVYPKTKTQYRLKVFAQGYDTLYAESYIPTFPNRIEADWDLSGKVAQADQFGGVYDAYRLAITLKDPADEKNYYMFGTVYYDSCVCLVRTWDENTLTRRDTIFKDPLYDKLKPGGLYSDISDATYSDLARVLLTDETFNGLERKFDVLTPDTAELFYGIRFDVPPREDADSIRYNNVFVRDRLYVEIFADTWSLSEDFYQYLSSYFLQGVQTANPFAEYSNVYSNVEGGLGIFAGYQRELTPIYPN